MTNIKRMFLVSTASYIVFVSRKVNVYCEAKLQKVHTQGLAKTEAQFRWLWGLDSRAWSIL